MKRERWEAKSSRGLILIFIFATIILMAGGFFYLRNEESVSRKQALKQLKSASFLKASQVEGWRKERLADAREISQSPLFQDAVSQWINHRDQKGLQSKIQQRLNVVIQNNPDFVNILITDTAGQTLLAANTDKFDLKRTTISKLILEVAKTKQPKFNDSFKRRGNGTVYTDIACPIGNHEIQAIVLFRLNPTISLFPILQSWPYDSTTEESFLFKKDGDSVLFLSDLKYSDNATISKKIALTSTKNPAVMAITSGAGFYEGIGYHGQHVMEYIQPIAGSPWFLASKIDRNELFREAHQRVKTLLLILFLIFLSLSTVLFLIITFRRKQYYNQLLVTERQQAALKSHYEYVVQYANDIILLEDENLNIIEANQRAQQTYQYTLDELQKMKITGLIAPEFKLSVETRLKNINENDGAILESIHQSKDGELFNVEISARIIQIDGQFYHHQVIRDITERKLAEMTLRESEERFRTMMYSTGDAIITSDVNYKIQNMNRVAESLTGWTEAEACGKFIREVFRIYNEDTRLEVENPVEKVLNSEMIVLLSNHTFLVSKDGREIPIGDSGAPIRNADGRITGVVLVFRDQIKDRLAKKALEESELHFHSLAINAPVGIFRTRSDGFTTYVNPCWCELSGLKEEKALGDGWLDAVHPDDKEMLSNRWITATRNKEVSNAEYRFLHSDGTIVYVMGHTVPEINSENQISGFIGTITDITKRKQAEEKLDLAHRELENLHNNLNDAIFSFDTIQNKMLVVSAAHETVFGCPRSEFYKNPQLWYELVVPQDKPIVDAGYPVLSAGKELEHEIRITRPDGHIRWIHVKMVPTLDIDGKLVRVDGIVSDITWRKQNEEELRSSEEKFRSVYENSVIGIYRTTPDGKIIMANHALLQILGYESFEEFSYRDLNSESYEPNYLRSNFRMLIERDGIIENLESAWSRKDGSTIFLSEFARLVRDENNNPIFYDGMVLDITERKKMFDELSVAKEKAEESDQLKSAFLSTMSHELRTPLNAVIGFSSLIDEEMPMDQITSFAKMIHNSGNNLLDIVEGILDLTLLESKEAKVKAGHFNLSSFMIDFLELAKSEQQKSDKQQVEIKYVSYSGNGHADLYTDKEKLTKVMIQLLKNALKFTSSGKIEFGYVLEPDGKYDQIKFFVKDTGIGISESQLPIIFNRFRQAEDSYTRKYGGTGIGLTISKQIVDLLGGHIWVDSDPGKGSTFYFTIPVTKPEQLSKVETRQRADTEKQKTFSNQTILIAEDEDSNFELLKYILIQSKLRIIRARDGLEAVNLCSVHPEISLVLMDINMPNMNGLEATKIIKQANPKLPVIAVTAFAMSGDREKFTVGDCDEYLEKPIKHDKLLTLLGSFLN